MKNETVDQSIGVATIQRRTQRAIGSSVSETVIEIDTNVDFVVWHVGKQRNRAEQLVQLDRNAIFHPLWNDSRKQR